MIFFKKILIITIFIKLLQSQDCCDAANFELNNCEGLGCYIPQCDQNCNWEPTQCWSSTGYCWCVDENGLEIAETSTPSWQGLPICEEFEECIHGEINTINPCNPLECFYGVWYEIIIDCQEQMGIPCDNGIYIPPTIEECCSSCILFGDINMDNDINILDISNIINIILNNQFNAIVDMNFDGDISILDVIIIIEIILN